MLDRECLPSNRLDDLKLIIEDSYNNFKSSMIDRDTRPMLLGKTIYINERVLYDGKENGFWHCSSMGENDTKFDQDPCENDKTKKLCKYKCDINSKDNFLKEDRRIPCVYRADKNIWVRKIIDLVNDKKIEHIKIWKYKDNKKKKSDLKIWYDDGDISYILIFEIKYKEDKSDILKYIFKSAYPVVLRSYRFRFLREYDNGKIDIK